MSTFSATLVERVLTRRRIFALSVVASFAAFGLVVSSLLPGAPFFPSSLVWAPFPPLFVVHLRSVLVAKQMPSTAFARYLRLRPLSLLAFVGAFAVFFGALSAYSIVTAKGNPERDGDRYYLRNHTQLTPVSRETYRHAIAVEERIFGGIPAVFFLLGVLINAPDRSGRTTTRRPHPSNPS